MLIDAVEASIVMIHCNKIFDNCDEKLLNEDIYCYLTRIILLYYKYVSIQ